MIESCCAQSTLLSVHNILKSKCFCFGNLGRSSWIRLRLDKRGRQQSLPAFETFLWAVWVWVWKSYQILFTDSGHREDEEDELWQVRYICRRIYITLIILNLINHPRLRWLDGIALCCNLGSSVLYSLFKPTKSGISASGLINLFFSLSFTD